MIITLLLSTQLLLHHKNPDSTLIPSQWRDWVSDRWKGENGVDAGQSASASLSSQSLSPATSASSQRTKSVITATSDVLDASGAPTSVPNPIAEAHSDLQSSRSSVDRPSPTAAYEVLETQFPLPDGFDATKQMFDLNGPPEHDPTGPRPDQIVLLTATDGLGHNSQVENIVNMAMHNRREYCARNGYINHFINMSRLEIDAPPVWKKLPAIIETFQTYPDALWVWWLDLDAIIMTPDYKLEDMIISDAALNKVLLKNEPYIQGGNDLPVSTPKNPDISKADLIIAQDHGSINAGSILFRRSEWTRTLLDVWRDPILVDRHFGFEEQDALLHIIKTNTQVREHVGLVGQRVLNCFGHLWKPGDLLVHFAGCWTNGHCQRNWDVTWKKRYGSLDFPPPKNETVEEKFPRQRRRRTRAWW